jgi:hypothetical protein
VKTIDGVVGDGFGEELGGICSDYPYVFETPSADAVDGVAVVSPRSLNAKKVDVRMCPGFVEKKGGFSCADVDVDGADASENPDKIHITIQIFGF